MLTPAPFPGRMPGKAGSGAVGAGGFIRMAAADRRAFRRRWWGSWARARAGRVCGCWSGGVSDFVQYDGEALREVSEVAVCGEDCAVVSRANCADENIGVGALNPFCAAEVVELCSRHVIFGGQRNVSKGVEVGFQALKVCRVGNSGQKFLSDGSDDFNNMSGD